MKLPIRIAVIRTKNGLRVTSMDINREEGKELESGHWANSTAIKKVNKWSKYYNIPRYNHYKDYSKS